ncbi:MAG: CHAT domain-containing protein [Acidobacteria bacterium]|nr:CHAT domain-containing protein [Acidobacteriota bacterium]
MMATYVQRAGVVLVSLLALLDTRSGGRRFRMLALPPAYPPVLLAREARIREIYTVAEQQLNRKGFDECRATLLTLLSIDPQHPLPYLGAVLIGQRRGDLEAAGRLLAGSAPSSGPGPDYGRATLRFLQGRDAEAEGLYSRALEGYVARDHPAGAAASYTGLGNVLLRRARYSESRPAYDTALRIVERLGDRRAVADLLSNLGNLEQGQGNDDAALADYRRALGEREALGDRKGLATALHNIAQILRRRGDDAGALESLERSLRINRDLGDRAGEARNVNAIGLIRLDRGDLERAADDFRKSLELARQLHDRRAEANALTNLGSVHARAGRLKEAQGAHLEALAFRRETGDRAGQAASLNNAASIREMVGDRNGALDLYASALAIERDLGDRRAAAVVLVNLGRIRSELGARAEGIAALREAIDIQRRLGDPRGEADAQEELGKALMDEGDYPAAREALERSLSLRQELRDRRGAASSLDSLGVLSGRRAELDEAVRRLEDALAIRRELEDPRGAAATASHLANARFARGELTGALQLHERALAIHRSLDEPIAQATDLNNIGAVYQAIGDRRTARRYIRESLARMRGAGDPAGEALARANLGVLLEDEGDREGAAREYAESIRLREAIGDRRGAALSRLNLGEVQSALGRTGRARASLEEALRTFRTIGDPGGEALALVGFGNLLRKQGRTDAAADRFRGALDLAKRSGMREEAWQAEAGLAGCLEADGRWQEALAGYERAISDVESIRQGLVSPELKSRFLARRIGLYDSAVRLLWRHGREAGAGDSSPERIAFAIAERSRARSLLDLLAESRADLRRDVDPALLRREAAIVERVARAGRDLAIVRDPGEREALEEFSRRAEEELELLKVDIRQAAPRYAALLYPRPSSAREVQESVLRPGEVLLEYILGEDASYVWMLTRETIRWHALPARATIESDVRRLLERLRSKSADLGGAPAYVPMARRLGRMLLPGEPPWEGSRLLIVADGILHYLPFEALLETGRGGEGTDRFLVERCEVAYVPSASALRLLREPGAAAAGRSRALLVLGDPASDPEAPWPTRSDPLPFAREEARRIGGLFGAGDRAVLLGDQATEEALKAADLRGVRYLHFAAHGLVDEEAPGRSGILLARGPGGAEDGLLQTNEIFGLRLGADMAVLSGCRTGLGRLVSGEGLTGLATAFLYAGVRSVVVSLWNVNDRATCDLMEAFYRDLLAGSAPAAALRAAKQSLLEANRPADRHPSLWAAFVLVGDPVAPGSETVRDSRREEKKRP